MQEQKIWTRSDCPICGWSYSHRTDYHPVTCGRFLCLQEANRRGLMQSTNAALKAIDHSAVRESLVALEVAVTNCLQAVENLLKVAKKDSRISESMIDYWKHSGVAD